MANSIIATGLLPIQNNGQPFTGQGRLVYIPASQATAIFRGDPIVYLGGGDAYGVPAVGLATAGATNGGATNVVAGAFLGSSNGPAGGGGSAVSTLTRDATIYHSASVAGYGFITDDPNQLFVIQEDSVGGAIAAGAGPGANGNLVAGAGNIITGMSGWMLQSSGVSASANPTYQLRLLGLSRGPDNVIGNNADWVVRLNLPQIWGTSGV